MWTYLAKFLTYNALGLKNYTTKTPMNGNCFQWILLIMHLGKTFIQKKIFIQILVSKLLLNISYLLFTKTFFNYGKETFLISLTLSYNPIWISIITDNNSVHFEEFSSHNNKFNNNLFTSEGEFKDWNHINVLYLNKMIFCFRKSSSPLCSFCKLHDETVIHL